MLIDAEWNSRHYACYSTERLNELYDHPHTLLEVLTRKDGEWKNVSSFDRMWVFWRAANQQTHIKVLQKIVNRAESNCKRYVYDSELKEYACRRFKEASTRLTVMNIHPIVFCRLNGCLDIAFAALDIAAISNGWDRTIESNKQLQDAIDTLMETN